MSWLSFATVAVVAAAWLLLPGLAVCYAMGLRGVVCWGLAPTVSVAAIGVSAVLLPKVGISWSPVTAALPILLLVVVVAVVALLLRNRFAVMRKPDPRSVGGWALLGLVVAAVIGSIVAVVGFVHPENIQQTYDGVFHYNAVASILDIHNASPSGVAKNMAVGFYPVGFHDVVSLAAMTTGASVAGSMNATVLVLGALVWPLGCLVLARQLFGARPAAMVVTAVVSTGFAAFPWGLFDFGVLWPNALGLMAVPAGLGAVCALVGVAKDDAIGPVRSIPVGLAAVAATGLTQPNTVFSLGVLALIPVTASLLRWGWRRQRDHGQWYLGVGAIVVYVAVLFAGWKFVNSLAVVKNVKAFNWPAFQSWRSAAVDVVTGGTNSFAPHYILGGLVVVGAVIALFTKGMRWVPFAHAVTAVLFILDASQDTPLSAKLTGFWYNDSFRIGAMLPITGIVLATLALVRIGEWILNPSSTWASGRQLGVAGPAFKSPVTVPVALLVVLVAVTGGMYARPHAAVISGPYNGRGQTSASSILDAQEPPFFDQVAQVVPRGDVIANDPWDGSPLLYALDARRVLYPHMGVSLSGDRKYLAQHMDQLATDPAVCPLLAKLKVRYLVVAHDRFWLTDGRQKLYAGVQDPDGVQGFTKVIDHDGLRLYRVSGC